MKTIIVTLMLLFSLFSASVLAYGAPTQNSNDNTTVTLIADFNANPTTEDAPLSVQFTDTSTGTPTAWQWDFNNDGTVDSDVQNPSYIYTTAGNYTVKLTVTNADGSDDEVKNGYIVVSAPLPAIPVAAFTATPTSGNSPLKVTFTDQSTGTPTAWQWDFNSDGKVDSNEQNPIYEFKNPGTYTVTLRAGNGDAWSNAKKKNYITALGDSLKADFTAFPREGKAPLTVQFTDTSTGTATGWFWDFGDGFTSTSRNPSHVYSESGTYKVKLTVTDGSGSNTLEVASSVNVLSSTDPVVDPPVTDPVVDPPVTDPVVDPPVTDPVVDPPVTDPVVNPPVTDPVVDPPVTDPVVDPPVTDPVVDPPVTDPVVDPPVTDPVVDPPVTDPVVDPPVTDPVVDPPVTDPVVDSPVVNTPVVNTPVADSPVVDFKSNITSGEAPLMVQFEDNSGGNPIVWEWDFNSDGQVDSNEQNPVCEFKDPGDYSVTLRAGNGISWGDATKTNYIIVGDGLHASFTATPTEGKAPLTVQFTDTSTGYFISWLWDFGDGNTSTSQNPIHTYSEIGSYSVTLNASNTYEYSVLAWTDCIKVTEEGESNGDGTGSSDTDGWGYTDTGAIAGGGGSPEPASNIDTTVLTQRFITAGSRIRYNFTQDATCIDFVEFDAKKTLGKATTIIEQLKGKSVLTPSEPGGTVYRYMNIWVGNEGFASPENIENAVIGFRVSKAEIPVNETDNSTVVLHRYASGEWTPLPTQKTGEDGLYIYFQAMTPGFSPFAITSGSVDEIVSTEVDDGVPEDTGRSAEEKPPEKPETIFTSGLISEEDWPEYSSAIGPFIGFMLILFIGLAVREKRK